MKLHALKTLLAALALLLAATPTASADPPKEAEAASPSANPNAAKPAAPPTADKASADALDEAQANKKLADDATTWFDANWAPKVVDRLDPASGSHSAQQLPRLGPLDEPEAIDPLEHADRTVQFQQNLAGAVQRGASAAGYWTSPQLYQWQILPQGLIYRSYLAGEKESRFRSEWNHTDNGRDIWDVTLGGNVGILRYGTTDDIRPQGWQLGIEGASQVRLDRGEHLDVDSSDFRFGIPMTWGDSIYQQKFAFYHLSSHIQDEFLLKHPGFPRLNYSRNVFVWGHSLYPTDNFRVYAEVGYGFVVDVSKPWEFQFGFDYAPGYATGSRGAPFAAVNGHLRQEVNYGGNLNAQAGWAWRRSPASGLYRIGVEYFNGKDDQFSFFNDSLQKIGIGMWYDY
jgi:hypothetical protein